MGRGRSKEKIIVSVSHRIGIRRVSNGSKAWRSPPSSEPELRRLHLCACVRARNEANVMTSVTQLARSGEHRAEVARGGPGGHEKIVRHGSSSSENPVVVFDYCRRATIFDNGVTVVAANLAKVASGISREVLAGP